MGTTSKNGIRVCVSAMAIAIAMGASQAAYAQTAGASEATRGSAASMAEKDSATGPEDIVVTAQFRAQNLQDTPLSITAFSNTMLEAKNVNDLVGAANLAPNVNLAKGAQGFGQFAAVFIRGVGQGDFIFGVEPGVGVYLDDIYYGVMPGAVFQLLDTDRVEILRGPQGTLSGKNSIGGSIKLYSVRPGPDANGYAELTYGGRNLVAGRAAGNFTIVDDKLFARISVAGRRRDGYVDRLDYACVTGGTTGTQRLRKGCKLGTQGGEEVWSARASLKWIINENIENTIIVDTVQDTSENPAAVQFTQSPSWTGTANYIVGSGKYSNYENYVGRPTGPSAGSPFVLPSNSSLDAKGVTNLLNIDLTDSLKLQSITGYRKSVINVNTTIEVSPASIAEQVVSPSHKQFTEEVRLSGEAGNLLDWTIGGYYYHGSGVYSGRINLPGGFLVGGGGLDLDLILDDPVKTVSKSAFVHTVWHPVEKMGITLAARYTNDKKNFTFNRLDIYGNPHPALGELLDITRRYRGNRVDYRANIDYQWTDDVMTYAQFSTGFKGGGVSPRPYFVSQAVTFNPETIEAYEIGFKSQFFDRAVTLNGSAFLNKFSNIQGTLLRCDDISPFPGAPCTATRNIGSADIKGIELETAVRPLQGLLIDGTFGYLDFQYKNVNSATGVTKDMSSIFAPKFSLAAGVQYEASLGDMGSITPRLDYTYRSHVFTEAVNLPINKLPKLGLFNAKITWNNESHDWSAAFAVTNIANKYYFESNFIIAAPFFSGTARPGQPRQWSLTVKRTF